MIPDTRVIILEPTHSGVVSVALEAAFVNIDILI